MDDITTIQLRKKTAKRLMDLAEKRETYEDIIIRLLENQEQQTA